MSWTEYNIKIMEILIIINHIISFSFYSALTFLRKLVIWILLTFRSPQKYYKQKDKKKKRRDEQFKYLRAMEVTDIFWEK